MWFDKLTTNGGRKTHIPFILSLSKDP